MDQIIKGGSSDGPTEPKPAPKKRGPKPKSAQVTAIEVAQDSLDLRINEIKFRATLERAKGLLNPLGEDTRGPQQRLPGLFMRVIEDRLLNDVRGNLFRALVGDISRTAPAMWAALFSPDLNVFHNYLKILRRERLSFDKTVLDVELDIWGMMAPSQGAKQGLRQAVAGLGLGNDTHPEEIALAVVKKEGAEKVLGFLASVRKRLQDLSPQGVWRSDKITNVSGAAAARHYNAAVSGLVPDYRKQTLLSLAEILWNSEKLLSDQEQDSSHSLHTLYSSYLIDRVLRAAIMNSCGRVPTGTQFKLIVQCSTSKKPEQRAQAFAKLMAENGWQAHELQIRFIGALINAGVQSPSGRQALIPAMQQVYQVFNPDDLSKLFALEHFFQPWKYKSEEWSIESRNNSNLVQALEGQLKGLSRQLAVCPVLQVITVGQKGLRISLSQTVSEGELIKLTGLSRILAGIPRTALRAAMGNV